ncbi:hypothetical protein RND71_031727 [Anisodus tanguticus]|uniref:Uncharacterized protein n=1 Tax=Anisodus tanguticus TaxID=243964 RepID=A0AAE1RDU4_9SOLA|nr:hypothetical protein RND71_031727 [Anisodus tanguticus]
MAAEYDDGGYDRNRGYGGRGRGRGRGRNFRGRERGGYNGPRDAQQDGGFYNQEAPMQGRGRGRGRGTRGRGREFRSNGPIQGGAQRFQSETIPYREGSHYCGYEFTKIR